jgi:hypothetical protein
MSSRAGKRRFGTLTCLHCAVTHSLLIFERKDHNSVASIVETLAKIELWVFAIAVRLHYRCKKVATEGSHSAAASKKKAATAAAWSVPPMGLAALNGGASGSNDSVLVSFALGTLKSEVDKLLRSMGMVSAVCFC